MTRSLHYLHFIRAKQRYKLFGRSVWRKARTGGVWARECLFPGKVAPIFSFRVIALTSGASRCYWFNIPIEWFVPFEATHYHRAYDLFLRNAERTPSEYAVQYAQRNPNSSSRP